MILPTTHDAFSKVNFTIVDQGHSPENPITDMRYGHLLWNIHNHQLDEDYGLKATATAAGGVARWSLAKMSSDAQSKVRMPDAHQPECSKRTGPCSVQRRDPDPLAGRAEERAVLANRLPAVQRERH